MMHEIRFILNDHDVRTAVPPGLLVLDFLRRRERATGTKEGCREGDCGACTILVGEWEAERVVYRPVTSCLMPAAEMHGKHIVTIEGLNMQALSPVQQAIVTEGATQCGFCTPGIVVSLTGSLLDGARRDVKEALSGHLCRCTGYRSLKRAGQTAYAAAAGRTDMSALVEGGFLPDYFLDIPDRLRRLQRGLPSNGLATNGIPVAGGTDLYVQRGEDLPGEAVAVLNLDPELRGIRWEDGFLRVGACTTFEAFADHPEVQRLLPDVKAYMFLIASWQIRNRATLGGNIVNASPIGDVSILLLALDAVLVLRRRLQRRQVPLRSFFLGYKQCDLAEDERVEAVLIPAPAPETRVNFEKVSKRKCLDIASVNAAICVCVRGGVVAEMGLAVGGVAPIPLYLRETSRFFVGKPVVVEVVREGLERMQAEIAPIDDVRGSAAYKRLLARQLLLAHFTRLFPESIELRHFYATP